MNPHPPLQRRIDAGLQRGRSAEIKLLLVESKSVVDGLESLLLDFLAQNPDFRAHGGLHARVASFLQEIGDRGKASR